VRIPRYIIVSFVILITLTNVSCGAILPSVTPTIGNIPSSAPTATNTSLPTVTPSVENTPMPSTPTTEGAIDVGGYKLIYQCFGEGTPAVIVEAGGGDKPVVSLTWSTVIQNVYPYTRICIYDRVAGVRTSQRIAEDLHTLLSKIPVPGPYILVAHSIGGYHARVFAHLYPEKVAGMILVDTTTTNPETKVALATAYPTYSPNETSGITQNRLSETDIFVPFPTPGIDGLDFNTSNEQVRQAGSLGDLPLIVISHNVTPADFPGVALPVSEAYAAVLLKLQGNLATLSSKSVFMVAKTSNHFISSHEPQIIIDAIIQMVKDIRNH
jgi:pimeloyl-ACP methyl ester carboxylesterase